MQYCPFSCLAFAVLLHTFELSSADLPVHCLRHQVAGDWEFALGPLGSERTACGHKKPDSPYSQPSMKFLQSLGPLSKRRFTLNDPSTVAADDGKSGTWTMIYDEGFEVAMGDFVYFAFSKFEFTDPEQKQNVSHCDKTQIGWYHDAARSKWGCYVGRKVDAQAGQDENSAIRSDTIKSSALQSAPVSALQAFGSEVNSVPQPPAASPPDASSSSDTLTSWLDEKDPMALAPDPPSEPESSSQNAASEDTSHETADDQSASTNTEKNDEDSVSYDDMYATPAEYKPWVPSSAGFDKPIEGSWQQTVAAALNFLQLGWTAHAYEKFQGKTPRELNMYAGVRRSRLRPHSKQQQSENDDVQEGFASFLGVSRKVHRSSFEGEAFDWRNKDGKNWLEPVVTQGDCGSCYTISTVHMLTARNKIRSGSVSEPSFSVSFPLYCSEYNQGCDGGYGFLQSKWIEDVGLVPEQCAPFSQGGGTCSVTPSCNLGDKRYRANNHHYVGGYYGGSDADKIRTELVQRGPVVMSFEPQEDFMYYQNGVYKSVPNKIHQEWEQVDHAVLLVGYGFQKSQPYWTMQNSWGSDWGEAGYFRMARGSDESGCESIVVAAEVVQESNNQVLDSFLAAL